VGAYLIAQSQSALQNEKRPQTAGVSKIMAKKITLLQLGRRPLVRLLHLLLLPGLGDLHGDWQQMLSILAVMSIRG
jgi:hypothetical protein